MPKKHTEKSIQMDKMIDAKDKEDLKKKIIEVIDKIDDFESVNFYYGYVATHKTYFKEDEEII